MENIENLKDNSVHLETVSQDEVAKFADSNAQLGAQLMEDERQLGVWANVKLHKRVLLFCSISFTAGMLFGYDTIVNGASISMPSFLLYFGEIGPTGPYLPSKWTSLWTAMSSLVQAIGAFAAGYITDRLGRKWPASGAGAVTLIGTAVQYIAHSRGALLGGKMVTGFGVGSSLAIATSYASEIAPLRLRAPVQAALVMFTVFMQGLALGIIRIFVPSIQEIAFRHVFAIQWAVGGLATLAFALAPESPVFLINRNRLGDARKAMAKIYGSNNSIDARLAYLIKTIREEQSQMILESGSYMECFKGKDLKRTLTVILLYISANVGGAAFLSQNIYFLLTAGLPAIHSFDIGIGGFGLAILIIIASNMFMKHINRRKAFLVGCILNIIFMLVISALYYAPGTGPLWAIAVLMNILISLQTSLLQGIGWPIAAELSSYRLRAKTLSIAVIAQTFTTWLTVFVVPYMYNVDAGNLGARTGFIFMGLAVFLLVGAWYLVPDTSSLTTEEIDLLYEDKVSPRHFQRHVKSSSPASGYAA
ncbi:hypothetical protein BP6252_04685 [Coleophoma cylindrospora]|uniref:Major facilitator superfamily (MFS) profile domain-containing protein n=1 Tax=Coleophoma cylindrospora TaxID=1849047 RepID=A0A3D8S171_9HELO|nr:hypothetical protein BP6252_04685 [Coleophoma cylindrospora]